MEKDEKHRVIDINNEEEMVKYMTETVSHIIKALGKPKPEKINGLLMVLIQEDEESKDSSSKVEVVHAMSPHDTAILVSKLLSAEGVVESLVKAGVAIQAPMPGINIGPAGNA